MAVEEEAACAADAAAAAVVKMVELPVPYLKWVLAQRAEHYRVPTLDDYSPERIEKEEEAICRAVASLQAAYDEFPELMAFVRDVVEMNGCVVVPEGKLIPNFRELQRRIDQEWAGAKHELADMASSADSTASSSETTVPPLGPHLYTLSTFLSLIYGYVSRVVG
ncbi:hypothetical protein ACP70R_044329 [Stipagrostis hirtigluma subsp. patula]